jgi:hypothetical protein
MGGVWWARACEPMRVIGRAKGGARAEAPAPVTHSDALHKWQKVRTEVSHD